MGIDIEHMLKKIRDNQWALADIDWDAPGAEMITDDQRPRLKAFMADLVWIEQLGARGFAALATKAPNETLKQIYILFSAEEQRHANAELALMRRWGMLADDEIPMPNINLRITMRYLDEYGDGLPLSHLAAFISILEFALDGALLKFLLEEVQDPLCHEVFAKINGDEARHLGIDFHILEELGSGPRVPIVLDMLKANATPAAALALATGVIPMFRQVLDSLAGIGLGAARIEEAIDKYEKIGNLNQYIARNPAYQMIRRQAHMAVDMDHPYQLLAKSLLKATSKIPEDWVGPIPSWSEKLTWKPVV